MADEPFSTYVSSRPGATPPVGSDLLLISQSGVINAIPYSNLVANIPKVLINASSGPVNQLLPISGIVEYIRDDNSGNPVTITPAIAGQTVIRQPSTDGPSVQDEFMVFQLIGTNWYRVG
ncbi:hypothetical protein F6V30_13935 [Oryzomonas sagensis]|uniref:Uncharacterized protein n=1 Tax=Oryzomonas sagensis TaxID=2603857 RepID=A0ABQ6TKZ1_9BACT|nr:hypothetical protein [Oryzomonas sagensis]KAB0668933.1 hypothetical protein F6V30_13935 [Oryzomonas sagensis]